jgi:hypothetical protein
MKILKTFIIIFLVLITFSFISIPVLAQEGEVEPVTLTNPLGDDTNTLGDILSKIIDKLQILAIPIVAIMVLIGGFQILFAAGDPEKFNKGKKTILYSVIGYAIILLANGIDDLIRDILNNSVGN